MPNTTTKTFNRGKLRRLAQAGKLTMVGSYAYDEMTGSDREQGAAKPVGMKPERWEERLEGTVYLREKDFTSTSGSAWQNSDGTVTLYIHSNANYTFRVAA